MELCSGCDELQLVRGAKGESHDNSSVRGPHTERFAALVSNKLL